MMTKQWAKEPKWDIMTCGHGFVTDPKKIKFAEKVAKRQGLIYKIKFLSPELEKVVEGEKNTKFKQLQVVYTTNDDEGRKEGYLVVKKLDGFVISEELLK